MADSLTAFSTPGPGDNPASILTLDPNKDNGSDISTEIAPGHQGGIKTGGNGFYDSFVV